ncbi:MAG: hypothetical protein AB7S26_41735 [Sandaracinaceae bacterium]
MTASLKLRVVPSVLAIGLAVAGALAPASALARDVCDRDAGICVTVPDSWTTNMVNGVLVISEPGRTMALELRIVTQLDQLARARADFERELGGRFDELQWRGEATPAQQNGMTGIVRTGGGRFRDATREQIRFFMLALGHQRAGVVGLGIITERGRANAAVMEMILNSIRAAS